MNKNVYCSIFAAGLKRNTRRKTEAHHWRNMESIIRHIFKRMMVMPLFLEGFPQSKRERKM